MRLTTLAKLDGETLMTIISISNHLKRIADLLEKQAQKQPSRVEISGKDPEVQRMLNTPDKPQAVRNKWTAKEEELLIGCYAKGWKPRAIREFMEREGFKRSEHAIVDHMHDLRKRMK